MKYMKIYIKIIFEQQVKEGINEKLFQLCTQVKQLQKGSLKKSQAQPMTSAIPVQLAIFIEHLF